MSDLPKKRKNENDNVVKKRGGNKPGHKISIECPQCKNSVDADNPIDNDKFWGRLCERPAIPKHLFPHQKDMVERMKAVEKLQFQLKYTLPGLDDEIKQVFFRYMFGCVHMASGTGKTLVTLGRIGSFLAQDERYTRFDERLTSCTHVSINTGKTFTVNHNSFCDLCVIHAPHMILHQWVEELFDFFGERFCKDSVLVLDTLAKFSLFRTVKDPRYKIILVSSIFSMTDVLEISQRKIGLLFVDDAHVKNDLDLKKVGAEFCWLLTSSAMIDKDVLKPRLGEWDNSMTACIKFQITSKIHNYLFSSVSCIAIPPIVRSDVFYKPKNSLVQKEFLKKMLSVSRLNFDCNEACLFSSNFCSGFIKDLKANFGSICASLEGKIGELDRAISALQGQPRTSELAILVAKDFDTAISKALHEKEASLTAHRRELDTVKEIQARFENSMCVICLSDDISLSNMTCTRCCKQMICFQCMRGFLRSRDSTKQCPTCRDTAVFTEGIVEVAREVLDFSNPLTGPIEAVLCDLLRALLNESAETKILVVYESSLVKNTIIDEVYKLFWASSCKLSCNNVAKIMDAFFTTKNILFFNSKFLDHGFNLQFVNHIIVLNEVVKLSKIIGECQRIGRTSSMKLHVFLEMGIAEDQQVNDVQSSVVTRLIP